MATTIRFMPHRQLKDSSSETLILILDRQHSSQNNPPLGNHKNVVVTKFDDIENPKEEWGSAITANIANTILNATKDTNDDIIVSCRGGVSRSAAVTLALSELNLAQIQGKHPCNDTCCPNRLVFDTIIRQAEKRGIKPLHTKEETDIIFIENQKRFTERLNNEL